MKNEENMDSNYLHNVVHEFLGNEMVNYLKNRQKLYKQTHSTTAVIKANNFCKSFTRKFKANGSTISETKRNNWEEKNRNNRENACMYNCLGFALFGLIPLTNYNQYNYFALHDALTACKHSTPQDFVESFYALAKDYNLNVTRIQSNQQLPKTTENSWNVALYLKLDENAEDFHVLRQSPDGSWIGKAGWSNNWHLYKNLPDFHSTYGLIGVYNITNTNQSETSSDNEK